MMLRHVVRRSPVLALPLLAAALSACAGDRITGSAPEAAPRAALSPEAAGIPGCEQPVISAPLEDIAATGIIRFRCRGRATGDAEPRPLFVLDGVPQEGVKVLRPVEIESVEILKPSAAVLLYGNAAQGGAVVIRTRKAAAGAS